MKNNQQTKLNFSPLHKPKKVKCESCDAFFALKFVIPKWDYSQKNKLDYWSEREEHKGKYECNSCLLDLYYNRKHEYWNLVTNPQKRQKMRSYVYDGTIS
ncbi:MAG: hypothetical protein mread185_000366 [Mycoplasmataceae bacterium]|nr:MAG: hypothetical protein mread185_000366 [Mycoplasmataceae bacterium]